MLPAESTTPSRRTQSDRRARSRGALLEAAAREMSTYGFGNVKLERIASEAGFTRGALYHQFRNKEDLALAVVEWVQQTWYDEVGGPAAQLSDPVEALIAAARGHVIYCRRDIARVLLTLRVEFAGQDHPVGRAIDATVERLVSDSARRITRARRQGLIPAGPPPRLLAHVYAGVVESVAIDLAAHPTAGTDLAERAVRGLLGLPPRHYTP